MTVQFTIFHRNIQMTNRHMKSYPESLLKKMKIKTKMSNPSQLLEWLLAKR